MRDRRVLVLLFTCVCLTAMIGLEALRAEPQKSPVALQTYTSGDAKMEEQKLQLDRDRLEFEKKSIQTR
jgi:hypothetical protein